MVNDDLWYERGPATLSAMSFLQKLSQVHLPPFFLFFFMVRVQNGLPKSWREIPQRIHHDSSPQEPPPALHMAPWLPPGTLGGVSSQGIYAWPASAHHGWEIWSHVWCIRYVYLVYLIIIIVIIITIIIINNNNNDNIYICSIDK